MNTNLSVSVVCAWFLFSSTGCSVVMALSGNQQPDFKAFKIGSSRQVVEFQLGEPISSEPLGNGQKRDTYRYEMGNSPNGHRALMNLWIDLGTFLLWEIPATIAEAAMGEDKETSIVYSADDRVVALEGYVPPEPTGALKEAIEAQEEYSHQTSVTP